MLAQLVSARSVSSTIARYDESNRGTIDLLANWCESIGMQVSLMPVDETADKWNLLASTGPGSGGLVLSGHSDTVPCDESSWHSDPFKLCEKDQRWYGRGVCDMKGFFPMALQAIEEAKHSLKRPLSLVVTANEETNMSGARQLLEAGELLGDYVLIGEPTGLQPICQHKGILMEEIIVVGRSGHSSKPSLGRNALEAMTDVMLNLRALREQWSENFFDSGFEVPVPTLNLGYIHGGDNPNRICQQCNLQFDVRVMPGMQLEEIRADIRESLSAIAKKHDVNIELHKLLEGVPTFKQEKNSRLIELCESVTGICSGCVGFATEAPFFKALGSETVVLGPGSVEQAHQSDEYLAMDQVEPMMGILRKLINDLCVKH